MGVLIDGINYEKLGTLTVGKYEYTILHKGDQILYATESNGAYSFPNPDLSLQGNANIPLSDLNSRIIMKHVKGLLEQENLSDRAGLINKIYRIQKVLQNNELYTLIKGSVKELSDFEGEKNRLIEKFNEINTEITEAMPIIEPEVKYVEPQNDLNENANIDAFMIAIIVSIGMLLVIMLILNIIR